MKKSNLITLVIGVLLLGASFWVHSLQKNHDSILKHADRTTLILGSLIEETQQTLESLSADTSFVQSPFASSIVLGIPRLVQKGITVFAYQDDSLVFWSSNLVPFPRGSPNDTPDTSLVWVGNGWYYSVVRKAGDFTLLGLILVTTEYPFNNQYLTNSFNEAFQLPPNTSLTLEMGHAEVRSPAGLYLFSISEGDIDGTESGWPVILFLFSYLFILLFLAKAHQVLNPFPRFPALALLFFAVDALLLRFLVHYFDFPNFAGHTALFKPALYSAGPYFESLGQLCLNAFTLVVVATQTALFAIRTLIRRSEPSTGFLMAFIAGLVSFFILWASNSIAQGVFLHSSLPLNFTNLFSFTSLSYLGLFLIILVHASAFMLIAALSRLFYNTGHAPHFGLWAILLSSTIFLAVSSIGGEAAWFTFGFGLTLLLLLWSTPYWLKGPLSLSTIVISTLLFSVMATVQHNGLNESKEKQQRILLAGTLAKEQDPTAEYLYNEAINKMPADTALRALIDDDIIEEDLLSRYILYQYFNKDPHWKGYNFQVTICEPFQQLIISSTTSPDQTKVNCDTFFNDLARKRGRMTLTRNLIYIDYGTRQDSYLGIVTFEQQGKPDLTVNIEFVSREVRSDLGFPALLTNQQESFLQPAQSYSYAFYEKGSLATSYGKFIYNINLDHYLPEAKNLGFFDEKDPHRTYNHLLFRINDERVMFLSKENPGFLALISPISYFFLLFIVVAFIIVILSVDLKSLLRRSPSFQTRMQFTFVFVILASFIVVGWASISYLKQLNHQKNNDTLSEKAHSVLIEVEHKLSDVSSLNADIAPYLSQILTKFSNVFFTDINLFGTDGHLIASSRPQLFDEQLIYSRMHPEAFRNISLERKALYIHRESIGKLEYLSAYIPFRNRDDKLVAYLNLPYLVKEQELKNQIGAFLVTFINVYALLIALSILLAVLLASLITRPLRLIRDNLRKVSLGGANEVIQIRRNDEIGELVREYNRMVDKLEESAHRLAASERQSAWREMAKQVAHEIKNPLTPMKLSVQYLQKAWNDKDPQWDDRLKRFTQTIVEQIENLAQIASEFSDFAKMPETNRESVLLEEVVVSSVELFRDENSARISFHPEPGKTYPVVSDRKQLLRVFNNLIKNARQALDDTPKGHIEITLGEEQGFWTVSVIDNGPGISAVEADKIFFPNFTTKSSGMGLGLAIVRSIVEESGGEVSFTSKPGISTVFVVKLPKAKVKSKPTL